MCWVILLFNFWTGAFNVHFLLRYRSRTAFLNRRRWRIVNYLNILPSSDGIHMDEMLFLPFCDLFPEMKLLDLPSGFFFWLADTVAHKNYNKVDPLFDLLSLSDQKGLFLMLELFPVSTPYLEKYYLMTASFSPLVTLPTGDSLTFLS